MNFLGSLNPADPLTDDDLDLIDQQIAASGALDGYGEATGCK